MNILMTKERRVKKPPPVPRKEEKEEEKADYLTLLAEEGRGKEEGRATLTILRSSKKIFSNIWSVRQSSGSSQPS